MSNFPGREKRHGVRVEAELKVRIGLGDAKVEFPAVFTRDVSAGGIGVEISAESPDSFNHLMSWEGPAVVEIHLLADRLCRSTATVVWGHKTGPEGPERRFRVGLRFVEIAETDRVLLLDFVRSRMIESMLEDDKARREGRPPIDRLP